MLDDFDFDDFWKDSDYAREKYIEEPVTAELVRSVEAELGFRLPAAYVALMRSQNGGIPKRTCFPTAASTSWAGDHVAITGILGIGRTKTYSLLGSLGSRFKQLDWGYPTWGVCVCECPSAGHDMIMLDYRDCGPEGEPAVVHVDQECDYRVTFLAPDFETFVRGLVDKSVYDTSAEDLKAKLSTIEHGRFSTELTRLLARSSGTPANEATLRRLLHTIATQKGHFSLHDDPLSHLVYDVLFSLFVGAHKVRKPQGYLKAYPDLLVFGDGEVRTGGYAPGFVEDWLAMRMERGEIVERDGRLTISDAHREAMDAALRTI